MASTTFIDGSTTIVASWLNDVNTSTYTTVPAVQTSVSNLTTTVNTLATTVQNSSSVTLGSVSGTDTITGSATPAITSYVAGQTFRFTSVGANTTTSVTLNVNGLGAKSVTKNGATALAAGDIASGAVVQVTYDGTRFQLVSGAGSGGAVADGTLYLAKTQILNDYTVPSGQNALAVDTISVATGKSLTIPTGQKLVVVGAGGAGATDQYVNIAGAQTISGTKTFSTMPLLGSASAASMVRVSVTNGKGSTNTSVTRWTNILTNQGSDITYTDSATLGGSFTINTSGVYSISFTRDANSAGLAEGIGLNVITLTGATDALAYAFSPSANYAVSMSSCLYLPAGSVIRAVGNYSAGTNNAYSSMCVTRVA